MPSTVSREAVPRPSGQRRLATLANEDGVSIVGRVAESFVDRLKGLIGTEAGQTDGNVLIIERCRSIHTFGMCYPIDVAVFDASGVVQGAVRALAPMRVFGVRAVGGGRGPCTVVEREARTTPWLRVGDRVTRLDNALRSS